MPSFEYFLMGILFFFPIAKPQALSQITKKERLSGSLELSKNATRSSTKSSFHQSQLQLYPQLDQPVSQLLKQTSPSFKQLPLHAYRTELSKYTLSWFSLASSSNELSSWDSDRLSIIRSKSYSSSNISLHSSRILVVKFIIITVRRACESLFMLTSLNTSLIMEKQFWACLPSQI